jgi:hypothetical protein
MKKTEETPHQIACRSDAPFESRSLRVWRRPQLHTVEASEAEASPGNNLEGDFTS